MYKSAKVWVCVNNSDLGKVRKVDISDIKLVKDTSLKITLNQVKDVVGNVKLCKYTGFYVHREGEIDLLGKELINNFNSYEKALNLALLGDESYISNGKVAPDCGCAIHHWDFAKPYLYDTLDIDYDTIYVDYIFYSGKWYVRIDKKWALLEPMIDNMIEIC